MNPTQVQELSAATAGPTPADILRGAAVYLDRYGWTRGDYYATITDPQIPFPAVCAYGALAFAAYGCRVENPYGLKLPDERRRLFTRAGDLFDGYLIDHYDVSDADLIPGQAWNDEDERTVTDVTTVLAAAAADWDRIHDGGAR